MWRIEQTEKPVFASIYAFTCNYINNLSEQITNISNWAIDITQFFETIIFAMFQSQVSIADFPVVGQKKFLSDLMLWWYFLVGIWIHALPVWLGDHNSSCCKVDSQLSWQTWRRCRGPFQSCFKVKTSLPKETISPSIRSVRKEAEHWFFFVGDVQGCQRDCSRLSQQFVWHSG